MIVVVDDRDIVTEGYSSWFGREGITTTGFTPTDFDEWVESVPQQDIMAVEAFLIGECADQHRLPARIRERCKAPVIAVNDRPSLEHTLELFQSGVDDVVRKPVHVREILARINAIRRRAGASAASSDDGTEPRFLRWPRSADQRRRFSAAAPRAPHPGISDCQSRPPPEQGADFQRDLRHFRQ